MLLRNPDIPRGSLVCLDGTQYEIENGFIEVPADAPRSHIEDIQEHGFTLAQSPAAQGAAPVEGPQDPESEPEAAPEPPPRRGEVFVEVDEAPEPEGAEEVGDEDLPADAGERCLGVKRDGTRCSLSPVEGSLYCHLHQSQADDE
jgi:hypothetical protein